MLTPMGGGVPPFTEKGREQYDANRASAAKNDYSFDLVRTTCTSPGQPRLMLTKMPFAVFVRPRVVTFLYQWNRLFRQIAIGKELNNPALGTNWWQFGSAQGHAVGRWNGGALTVRTTAIFDHNLLDGLIVASDRLELTEHIRLRSPTILEDRVTISDPEHFTKSWDAVLTYVRKPNSLLPFAEDICLARLKTGQPILP